MGVVKVCSQCKKKKPYSAFYSMGKASGTRRPACKDCERGARKEYYHKLKKLGKHKKTVIDPEIKAEKNRKWYSKNAEYHRMYYHQNKLRRSANNMAYEKRNPDRLKALQAVARAVKSGKLVRPDVCQICGCKCKPQGHHSDYTKKLSVLWVCRECHQEIHRQHRFKERSNAIRNKDGDKKAKA